MIGDRLREQRERAGMSQGDLATAVGLTQQAIDAVEKGRNRTSRKLGAIAAALGVRPEWLATGEEPRDAEPGQAPASAEPAPSPPKRPPPTVRIQDVTVPPKATMPLDVPVHGVAAGNPQDGGFRFEAGEIIDYVRRGPGIVNQRDVYALYVTGDSMDPKFEHGELLYVSTRKPVRIGDYVIVFAKPKNEGDPEDCYVKRLARRGPDGIEVTQFNPPMTMTFAASDVARVHRVLTMAEVLGV